MSKALKGYILLMLITFCLALLSGGRIFYNLLIFQGVILSSMYYIQSKNKRNIFPFLDIFSKDLYHEDHVMINFDCHNSGPYPISECLLDFKIKNDYYAIDFEPVVASVRGYDRIVIQKDLYGRRRGLYHTGEITIKYFDPLRLFPKEHIHSQDIQLIIFPRIHQLRNFHLNYSESYGQTVVENSNFEDYSSIKKIRKYRYGDTIKKVHWKLTSKFNELYVKEFDETASAKVNILMNANEKDFDMHKREALEDLCVETAVAISDYALRNRIEVNIEGHQEHQKIVANDYSEFKEVLKALTTFKSSEKGDFYDMVVKASQKHLKHDFLILISPVLDDDLFKALVQLKNRGMQLSLVLLNSKIIYNQDQIAVLKEKGVVLYFIETSDEIKEKLEGGEK